MSTIHVKRLHIWELPPEEPGAGGKLCTGRMACSPSRGRYLPARPPSAPLPPCPEVVVRRTGIDRYAYASPRRGPHETGMTSPFHASYGAGSPPSTPSQTGSAEPIPHTFPQRPHSGDAVLVLRLTSTGAYSCTSSVLSTILPHWLLDTI